MEIHYTDYTITQTGVDLTVESSIKIQKYENKVSRLVFKVEDWLKETARLYLAILNPETNRYHYEPLIPDVQTGDYYYIVGTSLSYYPGKQTLLLIGVSPSFMLDDDITLDLTATVYVSREFKRLVVIDNFISDVSRDVTMPSLDYLLDNFVVMHDNIIEISIQTAEDLVRCNEAMAKCDVDVEQCDADLARCEEILVRCTDLEEQCAYNEANCAEHETQTAENLANARTVLANCNTVLSSCNSAMTQATNAANTATTALAQCQQILAEITTLRQTMNSEYNSHMDAMRRAYEAYMDEMQNGGEP